MSLLMVLQHQYYKINNFFMKHKGEEVCLLGNGPSLQKFNLKELSMTKTLFGINKSWTAIETSYHTSTTWRQLKSAGKKFDTFFCTEHMFNVSTARNFDTIKLIPIKPAKRNTAHGYFSSNMLLGYHSIFAGQMAIELALWMGFNPIWLLGFDAHNEEGHHYDNSPPCDRTSQIEALKLVRPITDNLGVKIFNTNKNSAIPWFEFRCLNV